MESCRSPIRHPIVMATVLAGALGLAGCGVLSPGMTTQESAAPSTSTAEAVSPQPEATAGAAEQTGAVYTVEQVSTAVAAVDSEGSALELDTAEIPDQGRWETTVDPGACEEAWRSRDEFHAQRVGTPVVSADGDAGRLQVVATVFADEQTAASAAEQEENLLGGACGQYTISRGQSGYTRERTNTDFPVQLPDAAEAVTAATSESVSVGPIPTSDYRDSQVQGVVGNVLVVVTYGAPAPINGTVDPDSVPVQAERAAAERAARQVITALVGLG